MNKWKWDFNAFLKSGPISSVCVLLLTVTALIVYLLKTDFSNGKDSSGWGWIIDWQEYKSIRTTDILSKIILVLALQITYIKLFCARWAILLLDTMALSVSLMYHMHLLDWKMKNLFLTDKEDKVLLFEIMIYSLLGSLTLFDTLISVLQGSFHKFPLFN